MCGLTTWNGWILLRRAGLLLCFALCALCAATLWLDARDRFREGCNRSVASAARQATGEWQFMKPVHRQAIAGTFSSPDERPWLPADQVFGARLGSGLKVRLGPFEDACIYSAKCSLVCCTLNVDGTVTKDGHCTIVPSHPGSRRSDERQIHGSNPPDSAEIY
jgi:hypothetical protein